MTKIQFKGVEQYIPERIIRIHKIAMNAGFSITKCGYIRSANKKMKKYDAELVRLQPWRYSDNWTKEYADGNIAGYKQSEQYKNAVIRNKAAMKYLKTKTVGEMLQEHAVNVTYVAHKFTKPITAKVIFNEVKHAKSFFELCKNFAYYKSLADKELSSIDEEIRLSELKRRKNKYKFFLSKYKKKVTDVYK